jgi:LPS-assembly lipoprotein
MTRHALAAILLLALTGCGFHLRNAMQLPNDLGPVRVVSRNTRSPLPDALADALSRAGAVAATTPADGSTPPDADTLNLVTERWDSIPLSVDAHGRAQEYTMRYAVIFNLHRADGSELVPQQAIELQRNYIATPAFATGTQSEQELLAREMRQDMVASILRRIDAVVRLPVAPQTAAPAPAPSTDAVPLVPPTTP